LIEFLHKAPFFVIPQQKPGLPLGLTSISQTRKGFQGSVVDIDAISKGRRFLGLLVLLGIICGVPSPALYAIKIGTLPTCLRGCWHGTPSLTEWMCRRMHSDAVCAGIRPLSGLREGISFHITAAISCTCGCRLPSPYIGKMIGYCSW
jgi:hypothetical protein